MPNSDKAVERLKCQVCGYDAYLVNGAWPPRYAHDLPDGIRYHDHKLLFPQCWNNAKVVLGSLGEHDGSDHHYAENYSDFKGWVQTVKQQEEKATIEQPKRWTCEWCGRVHWSSEAYVAHQPECAIRPKEDAPEASDAVGVEQRTEYEGLRQYLDFVKDKKLVEAKTLEYRLDVCPFCGEIPEEVHTNDLRDFYIGCANEQCPVQPETGLQRSEEAARKEWNWKPEPATEGEQLDKMELHVLRVKCKRMELQHEVDQLTIKGFLKRATGQEFAEWWDEEIRLAQIRIPSNGDYCSYKAIAEKAWNAGRMAK